MNNPLGDRSNPFGVTDDVLVVNDILRHELASKMREMDRIKQENERLETRLKETGATLEEMQALLDQYALSLEN